MKKICVFLLMFCLCLSGCAEINITTGESCLTTTLSGSVTNTRPPDKIALLDETGKPAYTIVRPSGSSNLIYDAASALRNELFNLSGERFAFTNDSDNSDTDALEILIGATNRTESAITGKLGIKDYIITADGSKLVVTGGSELAVAKAAEELLNFLEGEELMLDNNFRYIDSAEIGQHLVGFANQAESKIEVYDLTTGVMNESTLVFSYTLSHHAVAGLKLRNHKVWGDVAIACSGNNGYAAVISYPKGELLWQTNSAAQNPHSVELIPDDILVVASSAGMALRFFDLKGSPNSYKEITLYDAHGVLWDPENDILWALGGHELAVYKVKRDSSGDIVVTEVPERRVTLATPNGHDLAPVYGDTNLLWITTDTQIYKYNKTTKSFSTQIKDGSLVKRNSVKGVGSFADGSMVIIVPDGNYYAWTGATTDFYLSYNSKLYHTEIKSATGHYYKCRVWSSDYQ